MNLKYDDTYTREVEFNHRFPATIENKRSNKAAFVFFVVAMIYVITFASCSGGRL